MAWTGGEVMGYPRPMLGVRVDCATCGRRKKPHGRSAPMEMGGDMCDDDCPGYRQDPRVSDLWPGEMRAICNECGGGHPFHDKLFCGGRFVDPANTEGLDR